MTMDAPIPTPLKTRRTPGVAGEVFTTTTTAMDGHKKSGGGRRRRRKGSRSSRVKARTLLAVVALVLIGMLAMMVHINLSIFRQHKTERDGRQHIKDVFSKAGIKLSEAQLNEFPTWGEIREEAGDAPIIVGLETCEVFRNSIPPVNRSIGSLGMFNSGTNLVTKLVKQNCIIPERVDYYGWKPDFDKYHMGPLEAHGMRWQVPWGKHTAGIYREVHKAEPPEHTIPTESVIPVITVRHPYRWMRSMCSHPYSAKWPHNQRDSCPHVANDNGDAVPLTIKYAQNRTNNHDSLVHLWNDWYGQYYRHNDNINASLKAISAKYPRLMVRFEDLVFHSFAVTKTICHCAGGELRTDQPFDYIQETAKEGPGHGKDRTGMMDAWIKYSKPPDPFRRDADNDFAKAQLDEELLDVFHYRLP